MHHGLDFFMIIFLFFLLDILENCCEAYNIGLEGAKVFSGSQNEQFGYLVQQIANQEGKW